MLKAKQIVFSAPNKVELEEFDFDPTPGDNDIVIKGIASVISAGTELSCLAGQADWAQFPFRPGYGMIGEVIGVGKNVEEIKEGDIVLTFSNHASYGRAQVTAVKVPNGLDPLKAVFARMANVSMTALRVSNGELGDRVAVIGLGLVGNLCAQLFAIAGCDVIGIDRIAKRLEIARACGLKKLVNAGEVDPIKMVKELTDGEGCEVVVDATGSAQVSATIAWQYAAPYGEVILLGSYFQRPYEMNVTELLERIHLSEFGCITYKGAHEWRYPVREERKDFFKTGSKYQRPKHSVERNARINLSLIREGKLIVEPLLTHLFKPEQCKEAYSGLREKPEEFLGVVFSWR